MTSFTGSLTNFSGEPKEEGPIPARLTVRGEPEELLGERGGVPPAGNIEGNGLLEEALVLLECPTMLKATPAFASSSKDFICTDIQQEESFSR